MKYDYVQLYYDLIERTKEFVNPVTLIVYATQLDSTTQTAMYTNTTYIEIVPTEIAYKSLKIVYDNGKEFNMVLTNTSAVSLYETTKNGYMLILMMKGKGNFDLLADRNHFKLLKEDSVQRFNIVLKAKEYGAYKAIFKNVNNLIVYIDFDKENFRYSIVFYGVTNEITITNMFATVSTAFSRVAIPYTEDIKMGSIITSEIVPVKTITFFLDDIKPNAIKKV